MTSLLSMVFINCTGGKDSQDSNNQTSTPQNQTSTPQKSIPERIMEATAQEEVSSLLNGTTWHYTEDLSKSEIGGWLKVVFNDGQYTTYYANPSDGAWTEGGRGTYNVSEGRYANTGGKYFAVSWEGTMKFDYLEIPCEMTMTIDKAGFQLNVGSSLMRGMNNLTMGIQEGAYYNATHNQTYKGMMEFGDYSWD